MDAAWLLAPGGVGLFLLGMIVLTDGLRELAGGALRQALARFTRSPLSGAVTGAATTALIQSSSATTVTAVGFVGAGLLTFPQALGIVFGANLGTTVTGWLVALVGFKLHLGLAALPLVFAGVMMRLFGRGRVRPAGWALAGFSLLFIGIDAMQQGMASFQGAVTPDDFPGDTLVGRVQLILIGLAVTLITQSSSAGVAAAMAAIGAGTISLPQAAAMVVGMDVGTTCTALLAAVGGSTAMRQTAFAHLFYNVLTGILAFVLLVPYAWAVDAWMPADAGAGDAQIALVAFHSSFNLLGVCLLLPAARWFARVIRRLVPDRTDSVGALLDDRLLAHPAAAMDAALAATEAALGGTFAALADGLVPKARVDTLVHRAEAGERAVDAVRVYIDKLAGAPLDAETRRRLIEVMHLLDHLERLCARMRQSERVEAVEGDSRLRRLARVMRAVTMGAGGRGPAPEERFDRLRLLMRRQRRAVRNRVIADIADGRSDSGHGEDLLDAVRWLHRVSYHLWRAAHHLARARGGAPDAITKS